MHGEKQVVIRLLQGLGDCVEFSLVGAGIVCLRLAGHRADKVAMHSHSKADHIDSFLNIALPIAALLGVIYLVNDDIVLLLSVGGDVERGEPGFAAVLRAGEEVEDALLLADDAFLLLAAVGDALGAENRLPIFVRDFDLVLDGSRVFELALLGEADELLDVVPLTPEQRTVVRYGVIGAVRGRHSRQDRKLASLCMPCESVLQVSPRT